MKNKCLLQRFGSGDIPMPPQVSREHSIRLW